MPGGGDLTRRTMALSGLLTAGFAPMGRTQDAPAFASGAERRGLLIAPVNLDDQGPYAFAIDSAANASVIAGDLAVRLGLADGGEVTMHTVVAQERAPTVLATRLRTGALDVRNARLVVANRQAMNGLDGLLGADLLAGLRLMLNFRRRARVSITLPRRHGAQSRNGMGWEGRAPIRGEMRFAGLLLIDALVRRLRCKAIVDTGAGTTIVNTALARRAAARPLDDADGTGLSQVVSPTGSTATGEIMLLPELQLGGLRVSRVPVLVGDFHTFSIWGLAEEPAMLLGVDVLGLFETVIIDLLRGELLLDL